MALGFWLIISPFVLEYTFRPLAMWNDIVLGILIGVSAFYAANNAKSGASWLNVAFGAWLAISPLVLNHNVQIAGSNEMLVGAVVVILALIAGVSYRSENRSGDPAGNRPGNRFREA